MTDQTIDELKVEEDWRAHVYKDHLGFDTIGWGFLVDARRGEGLPKPVAEFWINYLVDGIRTELAARWPYFQEQHNDVQRALVLMAYQLGVSGVLGFKQMLAALARGERGVAAVHALDSKWARDDTPARAKRVAAIISGYPDA